ncbi:MAG: SGNH/GDSL hydrolase family protein [Nocardioides sp.]|nr:SGNH/GDSL hydrolase family protein [Nocardioides sp.]
MSLVPRAARALSTAAVLSLALAGAWELGADHAASAPQATHQVANPQAGWTDTWTAMQQLTEASNMPPAPFTQPDGVLKDTTLRTTLRVTAAGDRIRVAVSNEFGGAPLPVTKVAVARPAGGAAGVSGIEPGTSKQLTFSGHGSLTIPQGARYLSDPLPFKVQAGENLTVTMYLADGQASQSITSHPGSRTTTYLINGDHTDDATLPADTAHVDHWYFLSNVEVQAADTATVVIGDSITDGRGSTTNGNDRWTDQLADRLQAAHITNVSVLNEAAGGNRILADGLGPSVVSRIDRDIFSQAGASKVIVFEGVNDIGVADATPQAQQQVTADIITALDQMVTRAHAHGLRIYGATITPFGNNAGYDDTAGLREQSREAVNHWIRTSGRFDAVIDFDKAVRDPEHPDQIQESLGVGDWLHFNPQGYAKIAAAVPLGLLR